MHGRSRPVRRQRQSWQIRHPCAPPVPVGVAQRRRRRVRSDRRSERGRRIGQRAGQVREQPRDPGGVGDRMMRHQSEGGPAGVAGLGDQQRPGQRGFVEGERDPGRLGYGAVRVARGLGEWDGGAVGPDVDPGLVVPGDQPGAQDRVMGRQPGQGGAQTGGVGRCRQPRRQRLGVVGRPRRIELAVLELVDEPQPGGVRTGGSDLRSIVVVRPAAETGEQRFRQRVRRRIGEQIGIEHQLEIQPVRPLGDVQGQVELAGGGIDLRNREAVGRGGGLQRRPLVQHHHHVA